MSTRIRYVKQDGKLVSVKSFQDKLVVVLDTTTMSYDIVDVNTNKVVLSGNSKTNNLSTLKLLAKRGLTSLGVQFSKETRTRVTKSEETTTRAI